jgi:hypothetical protein
LKRARIARVLGASDLAEQLRACAESAKELALAAFPDAPRSEAAAR